MNQNKDKEIDNASRINKEGKDFLKKLVKKGVPIGYVGDGTSVDLKVGENLFVDLNGKNKIYISDYSENSGLIEKIIDLILKETVK